jgi:hypothetical protein
MKQSFAVVVKKGLSLPLKIRHKIVLYSFITVIEVLGILGFSTVFTVLFKQKLFNREY